MTDQQKIDAFVTSGRVTPCPPCALEGVDSNHHWPQGEAMVGMIDPSWLSEPPACPLRMLARLKIARALNLLALSKLDKVHKFEQQEFFTWIFRGDGDFVLWCDEAGLDPGYIRRRAKEIIETRKARDAQDTTKKRATPKDLYDSI